MASALKDLHDTYGPVVRTAPDELSFIDSSAWNAIYGQHHPSKPRFRKNYDKFEQNQTELAASIFVANDEDHHRMRRVLAHAFSERALRDQEPLIESHVNSLIQGLHNQVANAAGQVDLVKWFNWVAFDIVADLSFGEPFNCLKGPEYRSWVETLSKAWKIFTFVSSFKSIAPSDAISRFLIPKTLIQNQLNHFDIVINRVKRRIAFDSGRPDFISSIIQHNSKKAMSGTELLSNASTLIAAGTETVASVLPGITYLLVKHPEVMLRAVNEVRSKFDNEEAVCIQSVNSLVYLSAVLNEALRLYPAVPEGLPRVTPPSGCIISGNWVPGGTFVQISPFAANLSSSNFHYPKEFIPERWLGSDPRFASDNKKVSQPFSTGPRNCIGQNLALAELRLIIARILWNFDIEMQNQIATDDWLDQKTYMLWEKKPLLVKLTPVLHAHS